MNKLKNIKTTVDGIVFDSKAEAQRWQQLKILEKVGQIGNLRRQVKYVLIPTQKVNGKVIERECSYYADFVISETANLLPKMLKDIAKEQRISSLL